MILNENDEILVSQRKVPGTPFDQNWQFPGGYQEFGESWQETSRREVKEECDLELDPSQIKVVEVLNVVDQESGYHNVGVYTYTEVKKEQAKFKTTEPHKNTEWRWVPWSEFVTLKPYFIPNKYFFELGYNDLNKIRNKIN